MPPACPSDQYNCLGVCIPTNQPCGGGQPAGSPAPFGGYQPPTTGTAPVTGGGLVQDSSCGENGYRDLNGGCLQVGAGKTPILGSNNQILICGDQMCEDGKGENSTNCPKDCGGSSQPQGSPYGGQYPGQGPSGYQGQPGQYPGGAGGQGMGPGGMEQGNFGPSEAEMQKMDQQRFEQMKKGLKDFSRSVTSFQKMVKQMEPKLKKLGVSIPAELKAALEQAPAVVEKIKNAQTPEELDEIVVDVSDIGSTLQEWGPKFGDLIRLGNMLKEGDRMVKKMTTELKRVKRLATKNPELLGATVGEMETMLAAITQGVQEAKAAAQTDPDSALDILQEKVMDSQEEFWNNSSIVDTLQNLKTGLKSADSQVKKVDAAIKKIAKQKDIDTAVVDELKQMSTDLKAQLAELKALSKQADADPEELRILAEELWQAFEDLQNQLAEYGQGLYQPQVQRGQDVKFNLPQGFDFGPRSSGSDAEQTCNVNGVEMPGPCSSYPTGSGGGAGGAPGF